MPGPAPRWGAWRGWTVGLLAIACLGVAAIAPRSIGATPPRRTVPVGGYEATIARTDNGVAHIRGATLRDVTFGQGWASGEDRPCDLMDQVIRVDGQRARWLGRGDGDANVRSDIGWLVLGVRAAAARDLPKASAEVQQAMEDYAAGWNAQLEAVGSEGLTGWCAGEPWVRPVEPVEVYAVARAVALLASGTQVVDYAATAVAPGQEEPTTTSTVPGSSTTTAPSPTSTTPTSSGGGATEAPGATPVAGAADYTGSNGWALGSDQSASGGGLLLANPHLPWDGEFRFSEYHLTVPGEINIYGAQLAGLPGIGIGFTERFGWTHTTASGNRFTGYKLSLVPGHPTQYRYGDEVRSMVPTDISVDVKAADGSVRPETHRRWRSHYGPILAIPELPWSDSMAITYRDANIDNDEFLEQYTAIVRAKTLDDLIDIDRTYQGQTMFNTVAASDDGRAWYADTAATPNLSAAALAKFRQKLIDDPITQVAYGRRLVLLDGSDPTFEWQTASASRDPGLVPWDRMPKRTERSHVFNANDSFWLSNVDSPLEGDYSLLHGNQRGGVSNRTRENAVTISDTTPGGVAGADGRWNLDELAAAALSDRSFTATALRAAVVERCQTAAPVDVAAVLAPDGTELLAAGTVDLAEACSVLDGWDGAADLDSPGAPLWREFSGLDGIRWAVPFDPDDPVRTPNGLAPAPASGADPTITSLARAVQVLRAAGHGPDVTLRSLQATVRAGQRIAVPGDNRDSAMNIVGWATIAPVTSLDPAPGRIRVGSFARDGGLYRITGDADFVGYPVDYGNSFMLAVAWGPDGPEARSILAYSSTSDEQDPEYVDATKRFAAKEWTPVAFTAAEVVAGAVSTATVRG